jgi:hypothetical protein
MDEDKNKTEVLPRIDQRNIIPAGLFRKRSPHKYAAYSPKMRAIYFSSTDLVAAENAVWELVHECTGNPDLAEIITPLLMKYHPVNQRWRNKVVAKVQAERQKRRECRERLRGSRTMGCK